MRNRDKFENIRTSAVSIMWPAVLYYIHKIMRSWIMRSDTQEGCQAPPISECPNRQKTDKILYRISYVHVNKYGFLRAGA